MGLPDFDETYGYLPQGIHPAAWTEVVERFGWNAHRRALLEQLERVLVTLREANCMSVILNGSFTTAKETPKDFDLVYEAHSVQHEMVPSWIEDRAAAGGDIVARFQEMGLGDVMLNFFGTDLDDVPKGLVRIDLSSLDTQ